MPKKSRQETQAEQSARFKRDAKRLIDAGELSPTDAGALLEKLIKHQGEKLARKSGGKK